jgi:hypothetical protein
MDREVEGEERNKGDRDCQPDVCVYLCVCEQLRI